MNLPDGAELYLIDRDGRSEPFRLDGMSPNLPEGTIQEGRSYIFELRNVTDPDHIDLILDDEVLEALRSPNATTARWRWSPGFHAGIVEVRLKARGKPERRTEWTTDPDVRKLTRDDFTLMVREILDDSYALFSLSSFRFGVARGSSQDIPPISRLEFLRSRVEEIEAAVREIAIKPLRLLVNEHTWVPYHKARSLTGQELVRSLNGRRVMKASTVSRLPAAMNSHWPATLRVSTRTTGYDTPEHRFIKTNLRVWSEWLRQVGDHLAHTSRRGDRRDQNELRWAMRCRKLSRRLSALWHLPLFREVGDSRERGGFSRTFRRVPAYRRFYAVYRDMNLGVLNIAGEFLNLPLARTFDLYEMWAYLRLSRAAIELFNIREVDASSIFRRGATRNSIVFTPDSAILHLTDDLSLAFKRNYQEYWLEDDGVGSFSRTMQPDIAIRVRPTPIEPRKLIVLDAKYRVEKQLSPALASIHMYRDAIVEEEFAGGLTRSVIAAYLVTPDQPQWSEDWRQSDMPGRLFHPAYRSEFRFGAVSLRPGMPLSAAKAALQTILRDAGIPGAQRGEGRPND